MKTTNNKQKLQSLVDYVFNFLMEQGERSYAFHKGCRYRGPNNTKCALGCIMSEDEYTPTMEGLTPHQYELWQNMPKATIDTEFAANPGKRLFSEFIKRMESTYGATPKFLDELQKVHDLNYAHGHKAYVRDLWLHTFKEFCKKQGLNTPATWDKWNVQVSRELKELA